MNYKQEEKQAWELEITTNTVQGLLKELRVKLHAVGTALSKIPDSIVQYYKDRGNICKNNGCYTIVSYNIFKKPTDPVDSCFGCKWWNNEENDYKPTLDEKFNELERDLTNESERIKQAVDDIFKKTDREFNKMLEETDNKWEKMKVDYLDGTSVEVDVPKALSKEEKSHIERLRFETANTDGININSLGNVSIGTVQDGFKDIIVVNGVEYKRVKKTGSTGV